MSYTELFKSAIVIKRPTANQGYLNEEGEWITATTITDVNCEGSILPYTTSDNESDGKEPIPFKSGFQDTDAKQVFVNTRVYTVDSKQKREPDEIIIDGDAYVCWRVYDYMDVPILNLRHCDCVFVKRSALGDN